MQEMESQSIGPISNLSKLSIDQPHLAIPSKKRAPKIVELDSEDFSPKKSQGGGSVSTFTMPQ